MGLAGLQAGYLNSSKSEDSIRIDLRPKIGIDVDSSVLWLGVGRGVRVVGSGDIGRILAFLAVWGASAVCSLAI